ncbi:hypothetical protein GCM10010911_60690 [Paenibacillus nasutitermitis]|uniref:Uncharacterized protein n=1 Tax=Paenibacillus nasutitermitis TaxID=1652958 RepID=A0A916ZFE7_9BACL|nr:hypothetical protein GCM10010911_60690 [Paenibacillus nasutitermitis]
MYPLKRLVQAISIIFKIKLLIHNMNKQITYINKLESTIFQNLLRWNVINLNRSY